MVEREEFYGRATFLSPSANFQILRGIRVWTLTPGVGLDGSLPDARDFPHTGGPVFYLLNDGANSFTLKDAGGGTLKAVSSGDAAVVGLVDNTTLAGIWGVFTRTIL